MTAQDRAAAITTTILAIVVDALRRRLRRESVSMADVRVQIEETLRDEFFDERRQGIADRSPDDPNA